MEKKEYYLPENKLIDLRNPDNVEVVDGLQYMGELGKVVLKLLEQAKAENAEIKVAGFNTQKFTISYNGEQIFFYLNISIDPGDGPINSSHYKLRLEEYKQPWIRNILDGMENQNWLVKQPLTFTQLCQEASGQTLDLIYLKKQYTNLKSSEMLKIIGEETGKLNDHFYYEAAPGRECFKVDFKDPNMRDKFLNNDPEFKATFEPIVNELIPKVHAKLDALNQSKQES